MLITIRQAKQKDLANINHWWSKSPWGQVPAITKAHLSETSYLAEYEGIPAACLFLIMTNIKEWALLENFVANPALQGEPRKNVINRLVEHAEDEARKMGYNKVICLAPNDKLLARYTELGYTAGPLKLVAMAKELN